MLAKALCLAGLLAAASPAAAAVEVFRASGLFADGTSLGGTVAIDTTAGKVLHAALSGGRYPFTTNQIIPGENGYNASAQAYELGGVLHTGDPLFDDNNVIYLYLPSNLHDYQGGRIYSLSAPTPTGLTSGYYTADILSFADLQAGRLTAVPEPTQWALLMGGFGLAGVVLRRHKRANAVAA